jgi:hypothetical protein
MKTIKNAGNVELANQQDMDTAGVSEYIWETPPVKEMIIGVGFLAKENYTIEEIKLLLKKSVGATGTLYIEIRDSAKKTIVQGSVDIGTEILTSYTYVSCTNFTGNITLINGQQYYLTIQKLYGGATGIIYWNTSETGNDTDTNEIIGSADYGTSWLSNLGGAPEILVFSIEWIILGTEYLGSLCTYEDYIRKIGKNASEETKSINFANIVVPQAESVLCARTKKNWIDLFSTLNQDVRAILTKVVSNTAAIEAINYDMSGFSSRLEAQEMIENLRWGTEKLINELKNESIKNFIQNA